MSKKLSIQWYSDDGGASVFLGEKRIAEIESGSRDEVTARLKALGLRPRRWRSADWGFESTLASAESAKERG